MFLQKIFCSTSVFVLLMGYIFQAVQCKPVSAGDIGPGVYHAAIIGNYAGQLSGGKAVSALQPNAIPDDSISKDEESAHDFSESAAENNPSLYETVGSYGDHLQESHFPADYSANDYKDQNGAEYAEAESAASEHHEDYEHHAAAEYDEHDYHAHDHDHAYEHELKADENEIDIGAHFHDDDDFYSKPVPGIDHGKGAFSYSTTYEFKDPKY